MGEKQGEELMPEGYTQKGVIKAMKIQEVILNPDHRGQLPDSETLEDKVQRARFISLQQAPRI